MMTIEKTAKELRRRIEAAGLQEISLTMACNGDVVTIRPCHSGCGAPARFEDVEYFLVFSPSLPWLGGNTIEDVAKQLNNYGKSLAEAGADKKKLAEIRATLESGTLGPDEWEDLFSFYSDFYKDVFGHRPRDVVRPF